MVIPVSQPGKGNGSGVALWSLMSEAEQGRPLSITIVRNGAGQ